MKKIGFLFFIAAMTAFQMPQQKEHILFFGDSITQAGVQPNGYISVFENMLKQKGLSDKYQVSGSGIGGNKIYDLYLRMEEDVLAKNPHTVVIWIGVNDVWHKSSKRTGTDPDKFEKFYHAIIKKLQAAHIKVLLCTPATIGEKTDFSNEQDGDLNQYAQIIRNIAQKDQCGLIDLRKGFLGYNLKFNPDNKEKGILTSDGVHLNDKGNQFVADAMMEALIR